jgi:DNA-binding beta-propeller fold protein YncE
VGSLPTTDGTSATAQPGCLLVLNSNGHVVETIYGSLINGPWDMTWWDNDSSAVLFVTNVLAGTVAENQHVVDNGTVVRLNLTVSESNMPFLDSMTVIGNGFPQRTDPSALVIGATGVGLSPACQFSGDPNCSTPFGGQVLYVADTLRNRIAVITDPFTRATPVWQGTTLTSGGNLNAPLGLNVAPDGHIITVNGGNGWAIEITPQGSQIATKLLDNSGSPPGAGALFGVLYDPWAEALIYVDDATNTLNRLQ